MIIQKTRRQIDKGCKGFRAPFCHAISSNFSQTPAKLGVTNLIYALWNLLPGSHKISRKVPIILNGIYDDKAVAFNDPLFSFRFMHNWRPTNNALSSACSWLEQSMAPDKPTMIEPSSLWIMPAMLVKWSRGLADPSKLTFTHHSGKKKWFEFHPMGMPNCPKGSQWILGLGQVSGLKTNGESCSGICILQTLDETTWLASKLVVIPSFPNIPRDTTWPRQAIASGAF